MKHKAGCWWIGDFFEGRVTYKKAMETDALCPGCGIEWMKMPSHNRCWPSLIITVAFGLMIVLNFFLFINVNAMAEHAVDKIRDETIIRSEDVIAELNESYNNSIEGLKGEVAVVMDEWKLWTNRAKGYWWNVMGPETPEGQARIQSKINQEMGEQAIESIRNQFGIHEPDPHARELLQP